LKNLESNQETKELTRSFILSFSLHQHSAECEGLHYNSSLSTTVFVCVCWSNSPFSQLKPHSPHLPKHSSCSFTNMDYLPDDALREILLRMPFRSVAKSKCVCKRWLKIISTLSFPTEFLFRQHSLFNAYLTFIAPRQLMLGFFPKELILNAKTHRAPLSPETLIKVACVDIPTAWFCAAVTDTQQVLSTLCTIHSARIAPIYLLFLMQTRNNGHTLLASSLIIIPPKKEKKNRILVTASGWWL